MKTSWNDKLRTFCSREYRPHVQRISLLSTCISRIGCVKRSTIPGTMFAMDRRVAAMEKEWLNVRQELMERPYRHIV